MSETLSARDGAEAEAVALEAGPTQTPLRRAVVRGLAWKGGAQIALQAMRFVLAVTLARLLSPHEVGIAGMVLVFSTFIIPFADLGVGAALVQRVALAPVDISTVFWTSVAAGTFFTFVGAAASHPIASFYGEPRVSLLLSVLSLSFLITSLSATHRSLLVRALRFKELELRLVASYAVALPAAIVIAVHSRSAWAYVTFELTSSVVSTTLLWILARWRPSFSFSMSTFRDFGGFGTQILGSRLFLDLSQIIDKLLVGRWLGASPLGIYVIGSSLVLGPMTRIATPVAEVMFPAFSRIQTDVERARRAWLRAAALLAAFAAPAMFGMIVVAGDFIAVVLGDRWEPAVTVTRLLAIAGLMIALQNLVLTVLGALDRPRAVVSLAAVSLVTASTAVAVGLHWGINGVAAAYALQAAATTPIYVSAATRRLQMSGWDVVRAVSRPIQAGLLMMLALVAVHEASAMWMSGAARLALEIVAGIAVFIPALRWRSPDTFAEVRRLLRREPAAEV